MPADKPKRGRRAQSGATEGKAVGRKLPAGRRRVDGAGWKAVAQRLEADIVAGKYNDTSRLPPETALARALGVSRHTLRRAIAALDTKGLLHTVPHNGVFLAPLKLSFPFSSSQRFADALRPVGMASGGKLLSQRRGLPPVDIARLLKIAKRSEVIELEVVRTANDKPLCYVTVWLPADRFPRIGEIFASVGELRQAMALHGVSDYRRVVVRVSSRPAAEAEREFLKVDDGGIVLVVESISHDAAGEPTHVSLFRFAAERVDLVIEV